MKYKLQLVVKLPARCSRVDDVQPEAIAPLVTLAPSKPRPGLIEAVIWCAIFLLTQLLTLICVTGGVLIAYAMQARDPSEFLNDQLNQVAKAAEPQTGQTDTPAFPNEFGQALGFGMLGAQFASLGLILLVLPRRIGKDWKQQIRLSRPSVLHVLLILLITPGFILATNGIEELLQKAVDITVPNVAKGLTKTFSLFPWFLTFLAVGFGPGFVEEIWCRGFLGRGLTARYGLVTGVVLTSILFGLMHCSLTYAIPVAFMGCYLHFVYLVSRSIWISILLHTLNNTIGVWLTLSGLDKQLEAKLDGQTEIVYLVSFSLVLFASIALWTSRPRIIPLHDSPADQSTSANWNIAYPGLSALPHPFEHRMQGPASPMAMFFTFVSFAVLMYQIFR